MQQDFLQLALNHFYIMRSRERFELPKTVAVYCQAVAETIGEMRIHYAGFVHPYFGQERKDEKEGTPLIFEVRGHSINTFLRHGDTLAKLEYYQMSEEDDGNKSYGEQELSLSKCFTEPEQDEVG